MTSFVAWIGVDQRSTSSLNLASDSRISWVQSKMNPNVWDFGKKLFATNFGPHLLGYVGDVLFPSLVLAQITAAIDLGSVFRPDDEPQQRFSRIQSIIKETLNGVPNNQRRKFTIVYATRQFELMRSGFHVFRLDWSPEEGWGAGSVSIQGHSSEVILLGSGEEGVLKWLERWNSSSQGGTSRAVFSAFCNALQNGDDKFSGGSPQLVSLYREGVGRPTGIVWKDRPFLFGIPLEIDVALAAVDVQWRNSAFERVDVRGVRVEKAQQHHIPNGLLGINKNSKY